ncbi:transposase, partial [Methylobacterium trifolii]|uniref:transposase n=1 Tax=Methylobacterium trifolii TaxID=1003092 RepID=UPI001EDD441C
MSLDRPAYPSDVSDEEWAVVAPYLTLLRADCEQRDHELREVFNGLRYIVRTGAAWRFMPHDLPPWAAVYQQMQRWLAAESFLDVAGDLRAVLRMAAAREPEPSAVVLDSRTLRSSP